jgi:hypothetical protein
LKTALTTALALVLIGGALAWATTQGQAPAPPAASDDVPGVVSLGRPIAPYRAGRPPEGQIELRAKDPDGGRDRAVLWHTFRRERRGVPTTFRCAEVGPEDVLRRYPIRDGGSCVADPRGRPQEPWVWGISSGTDLGVLVSGQVTEEVERLTIAGPGGTFVVPRSRHGAFLVMYGKRATGEAVLTATLRDGSKRFHRFEVPPDFTFDEGAVEAADPHGLPAWTARGLVYPPGPRAGQTCVAVQQRRDLRARGARAGGTSLAPICSDLRRAPLLATTRTVVVDAQPPSNRRTRPRRTVLAGAAGPDVVRVAVVAPEGRRELPLADAGRAFLAIFDDEVRVEQLRLLMTRRDGSEETIDAPKEVGRARLEHPAPRPVAGSASASSPTGSSRSRSASPAVRSAPRSRSSGGRSRCDPPAPARTSAATTATAAPAARSSPAGCTA